MRDQDFFWEGVKEGRLLIQQCSDCSALRQPPGPMCPHCQSLQWHAKQASGRGTVYSWIVSRHPTELDANPRIVALIDLEEGVRMVSNLRGVELSAVREALPVEVFFDTDYGLPQFQPLEHNWKERN
ncbi:MAG TPA: OB-fold domain-containing protein [Spongiibacteraceae bacterium]|nr:OB-fold domain-containing protein [Spongiibacteraceae bacterium]